MQPPATIKIRNKRTGEVREIPAVQAQDFGLDPQEALSRLNAQQSLSRLDQGLPAEEPKDEFAGKKKVALEGIGQLEKVWGRGNAANLGTEGDLGLATSATLGGKGKAGIAAVGKKVFDSKYSEDLNIYKSALGNLTGVFSQAFGSGTPQEAEALRFLKNAPGPQSTDAEAKAWFGNVRVFLGEKPGELPDNPPDLAADTDNQHPQDGIDLGDIGDTLVPATTNYVRKETAAAQTPEGRMNLLKRSLLPGQIGMLTSPEGRSAALELATWIVGPSVAKGAIKGAAKVGGAVVKPFQTLGNMRTARAAEAAAQGKVISGDKILAALEQKASSVSSTDIQAYQRFLEIERARRTGTQVGIPQALEMLADANKAFSSAGKVGKSAKATFLKSLGDVLRTELGVEAPKVAQVNKFFEMLYSGEKLVKKAIGPTVVGGAIYGAANKISDVLR